MSIQNNTGSYTSNGPAYKLIYDPAESNNPTKVADKYKKIKLPSEPLNWMDPIVYKILEHLAVKTRKSVFLSNKKWYLLGFNWLRKEIEEKLQEKNIDYKKLDLKNLPLQFMEQKKYYEHHIVNLLRKTNILDTNFDTYLSDIHNQFYIINLYINFLVKFKDKNITFLIIRIIIEIEEKRYDNVRKLFCSNIATSKFNFTTKLENLFEKMLHNLVFPHYIRNKDEDVLINSDSTFSCFWNTSFFTYCGLENISRERIIAAITCKPDFIISDTSSCNAIFRSWLEKDSTLVQEIQKLSINSNTQSIIECYIQYNIINKYIQSSDFQLATDAIDEITDPEVKDQFWITLINTYKLHKMYDKAVETIQKIEGKKQQIFALTRIALDVPDIEATICNNIDDSSHSYAWEKIAALYARNKRYPEAKAVIEKIEAIEYKDYAWIAIVIEYAKAQEYDKAKLAIEKIEAIEYKDCAWIAIVLEYAKAQEYDKAKLAIEKIKDVKDMEAKSAAWRFVAIQYATAKRYDEAEAVIEKIENIKGWVELVEVYIKHRNYDKAKAGITKIISLSVNNMDVPIQEVYRLIRKCIINGFPDGLVKILMDAYFPDDKALDLAFSLQLNKEDLNIDDLKNFVKKKTDHLLK